MRKRRIFLPGLAILIGAVFIGASLGFVTTTDPTSEASDSYTASTSAGKYTVTMERFKRHGPEIIERTPSNSKVPTRYSNTRLRMMVL